MKQYDGMLVVNKPVGMVSKDVSRWLLKRLGKVRLGHVGTLDPLAEGILPLLLGKATRLQDYLLTHRKKYEFEVIFGHETDTLDIDGVKVKGAPTSHINPESLKEAAADLVGEISQIPPIYSAVKFKGKPLYKYARSGNHDGIKLVDLARKVEIHQLSLVKYTPPVGFFTITCSKGTYIRSVIKSIAEHVGSLGVLSRLVRTESSGMELSDAYTLDQIESNIAELDKLVVPMEKIDLGLARLQIDQDSMLQKLALGQRVLFDRQTVMEKAISGEDENQENRTLLLLNSYGKAFALGSLMGGAGKGSLQLKLKKLLFSDIELKQLF